MRSTDAFKVNWQFTVDNPSIKLKRL